MKAQTKTTLAFLAAVALTWNGNCLGQEPEIPEILKPWQDWVTWDDLDQDCPPAYNNTDDRQRFWPSKLSLTAGQQGGAWQVDVVAFAETWMPLPGSKTIWPLGVSANGQPLAVIERNGRPMLSLPAGQHEISGTFSWDEMPQRISVPSEIGILSLTVDDQPVALPNWDPDGNVWLKRLRTDAEEKNLLSAQVYRVVEDGIPVWLRTEVELTVSGKSREEELGWILPEGWKLATVESPLPVAVDEQGRMKAQVRAGKWTIGLQAFRPSNATGISYSTDSQPTVDSELIGFRARPELRLAELNGVKAIDVTQTTFPEKWRELPVYQWDTSSTIQVVEKMRGMGLQRPEGLSIQRLLWLDEDGQRLTYQDTVTGQMQNTGRLDTADDQQLGAVRIDGKGQLITSNPDTGKHGVEIRTRNLDLEAIGRIENSRTIPATGWQSDATSLKATLNLPPGWRVFALFGADEVKGDWLTAWSLLDLFLLLVFGIAVFRLWGLPAGLIAFIAFGLAYHEPGAPRITWLFLAIPVGLLRAVPEGAVKKWVKLWKYLAIGLLTVTLIPFLAGQIQTVLYPQLESPGVNFQSRGMLWALGLGSSYQAAESRSFSADVDRITAEAQQMAMPAEDQKASKFQSSNLFYDPKARIQTGPAQPEWEWNQVRCRWDGPVSADQQIRPILISQTVNRLLTMVRIAMLCLLATIVCGALKLPKLQKLRGATAVAVALLCLFSPRSHAQEIPGPELLQQLRERLLEPSDAFPRAAEIPSVLLSLDGNRVSMDAEIHTALEVAVPLPGRLPAWSPVSVTIDGVPSNLVCRKDGYLWAVVPEGVHHVVVESLIPDVSEWEWTFMLAPRVVSIDAPGWTVTGVRPNGIPEPQVFFSRERPADEGAAAYDRKDFHAIVAVDRHLETGLIWQVRNEVTRLSPVGKAVSVKVPLLPGERVLTSNVVVENQTIEVALGAGQKTFSWISELPIGSEIQLVAAETDQWVERWHLVTSPVWNMTRTGLAPIFESQQQHLVPVWHPWPGEQVTLAFHQPSAVTGETITVQRVRHETSLGSRQRNSNLKIDLESSLGSDFRLILDPAAEISSVEVAGRPIPVRRDGDALVVPIQPGTQTLEVAWQTDQPMQAKVDAGLVKLPVSGANVTSVVKIPQSRWVLWCNGPTRGPAVRFWAILGAAVLVALVLGRTKLSPLRRGQWVLLAIGLTQVHVAAALVVVLWLFLLAWRGQTDPGSSHRWVFNLRQIGLVLLTLTALVILVVVVGAGLLGEAEMFIVGNGSSQTYLQWFQPRTSIELSNPTIVSVSVWYYRLLMLLWALWLASALLRWLSNGWKQFSHGGAWAQKPVVSSPPTLPPTEDK